MSQRPERETCRTDELLGDERAVETPEEMEVSLRLLRHFASSVHHQQYHDTDIITLQVDVPKSTQAIEED